MASLFKMTSKLLCQALVRSSLFSIYVGLGMRPRILNLIFCDAYEVINQMDDICKNEFHTTVMTIAKCVSNPEEYFYEGHFQVLPVSQWLFCMLT
ncbi:hypothetical protein GOP47_0014750 [Adiantum capillus-veneris]|uniref:Uncharacterized protein n=1 Tax=Adiantum capillus-veneris TaxID=13818 RepID=A0A9D4UMX7_ADICA|nr:hypothetical protein GOP47_0014750 [Adiantum capillus-veneris]